jgi:hypothetical protein
MRLRVGPISSGGLTHRLDVSSPRRGGGRQVPVDTASTAVIALLTRATQDDLRLMSLPPVDVEVPIDRDDMTAALLEVVEKGMDHQAVPIAVAARMFQTFIGAHEQR